MPKEKVPAFQFYPKDFLTDEKVMLMSNTEIGIYIRLLCSCWLEGTLPLETESLARIAHVPLRQFTKLWENTPVRNCFQVGGDGRLHHKRLDDERAKQDEFRRRQTDAAASRWDKPKPPSGNAAPIPAQCSPISDLRSPISDLRSPSEKGKGLPPLALGLSGRFKVWRWMLDEWFERLGPHGEAFDVEAWLVDLDRSDKRLVPANTNWKWLNSCFWAEVQRRGLAVAPESQDSFEAEYQALIAKGPSVRP